ncbi:MAG: helix-turn-helix transcriptional regulator [Oscillospiraceae bacterium]|nr:helix-turn-helix transcriptional regulator [Oscillospiraceae bacterium]
MHAQRLRQLRQERGLTQRNVADGLNIAESSYQIYEYGRKKPGFDKLVALADFFDVSIDYLVGRTDNPSVNQ